MEKELNYRTPISRGNFFTSAILPIFDRAASYPRLMIEVFLRKNFGRRYYSLSAALTLAGAMMIYPFIVAFLYMNFPGTFNSSPYDYPTGYEYLTNSQRDYFAGYESWYIFFVMFIGFAVVRRLEIMRKPSTFDFTKHSLYMGDLNGLFYKIKLFGKPVPLRFIEIFFEPLVFFILGYVLNKFDQNLGMVLIVASILYSLSYVSAYANGTRLVLDIVDKMVTNEDLADTFAIETSAKKSSKEFTQDRPTQESLRKGASGASSKKDDSDEDITIAS